MDIGFLISPIINASGRLEDTGANRIAALLCTDANDEDAKKLCMLKLTGQLKSTRNGKR